eukprot:CAMPEP_0168313646 /NCGR_PEP_ID=MMETSP0210-20121227/3415_1 /TAXON_ID=40633 /ORGANISM="Condylostoma magnum, Strain COL2" /LENGTH=42 /DNA_ID= /DNA_START= /DNA_END= /DNA_ORIENTATION=
MAKQVNIDSYTKIIELCDQYKAKIFWPSSIASYGSSSPKIPG